MEHSDLNIDVLHIVMANFCGQSDISRISKTCRMLNKESTRYLLQDGVSLASAKSMISFAIFLSNARRDTDLIKRRLWWLCSFELSWPIIPKSPSARSALRSIFYILPFTHQLHVLKLEAAEKLFKIDPIFATSIERLSALRKLLVIEAQDLTLEMIGRLRPGLTHVTIRLGNSILELSPDLHQLSFLESPASTLRQLSIELTHDLGPLLTKRRFPSIETLHLDTFPPEDVVALISAFPALRMLFLENLDFYDLPDTETHRGNNQAFAATNDVWGSLEVYSGQLYAFYLLGITKHVPYLSLIDENLGQDYEQLAAVVNDTKPLYLHLRVEYADIILDGGFTLCCQQPGWQNMKCLDLSIDVGTFYDEELMELMDQAGESVKLLRLSAFVLRFVWEEYESETHPGFSVDPQWDPFVITDGERKYLTPSSIEAYADRLMGTVDNLESVRIHIALPRLMPLDLKARPENIEVARGPGDLIEQYEHELQRGWDKEMK